MHTVAIIIPTKNEARYLPRLLASLQSQTQHADDVVIADAGSTDETVAIAKTFGAKVVAGGSPAVGRNNGAAATRADIFVFLDADAILDRKDFLACVVDEFIARKLDVATVDVFVEHGAVSDRVSMTLYNTYVRLWERVIRILLAHV